MFQVFERITFVCLLGTTRVCLSYLSLNQFEKEINISNAESYDGSQHFSCRSLVSENSGFWLIVFLTWLSKKPVVWVCGDGNVGSTVVLYIESAASEPALCVLVSHTYTHLQHWLIRVWHICQTVRQHRQLSVAVAVTVMDKNDLNILFYLLMVLQVEQACLGIF